MNKSQLTDGCEIDSADLANELAASLIEEAFMDDHVITLRPRDALIAARALVLYAPWLEKAPATYYFGVSTYER
jgi:hypothetical protein